MLGPIRFISLVSFFPSFSFSTCKVQSSHIQTSTFITYKSYFLYKNAKHNRLLAFLFYIIANLSSTRGYFTPQQFAWNKHTDVFFGGPELSNYHLEQLEEQRGEQMHRLTSPPTVKGSVHKVQTIKKWYQVRLFLSLCSLSDFCSHWKKQAWDLLTQSVQRIICWWKEWWRLFLKLHFKHNKHIHPFIVSVPGWPPTSRPHVSRVTVWD